LLNGSSVYVGGSFTNIGGSARNYIAVLGSVSGTASTWNPNANNAVRTIGISGTSIYAGGDFTTIGGQTRNNIAALDAATALATAWNPNANAVVNSIALSGTTVFAGGNFTTMGGQIRNRMAAINATSGAPETWNPGFTANPVFAVVTGSNAVYVGGQFNTVQNVPRNGFAPFMLYNNCCSSKMDESEFAEGNNLNQPETFELVMNAYPNPFSEMLNIEFTLGEDSKVQLVVFNLEGKQLAVLFEGDVTAGVKMKSEYRPERVSPGILIYRIQTEQAMYHGKAILTR